MEEKKDNFRYLLEQFADIKIMQYKVPGFEDLSLKQKKLIYYLSQAALCGRDIIFDQNYKYNLVIRRTLEAIYKHFSGDRNSQEFKELETYLKRIWFSNGIHHHYSSDKIVPGFSENWFRKVVEEVDDQYLPLDNDQTGQELINLLVSVFFDENMAPQRVDQDQNKDMVKESANNFYEGVTQHEVEEFYEKRAKSVDPYLSHGLNSKLLRENGAVVEKVYKLGGMYSPAIDKIVEWLEKAVQVAESKKQKQSLDKLIRYYKTGSLKTWDEYNIEWVSDTHSNVDVVNGFIEVYGDPLGRKATWESLVNFRDEEATHRAMVISRNAQWFENNSPIDDRFKKDKVKGVSAKVINVAQLGGECYPATPIGINLPNADWIRREYGSKSVTLDNIMHAYHQASLNSGFLEEFAWSEEEMERAKKHGMLASSLHTDLHECLGHGSGQLAPGVNVEALKNYHSPLEEARADLFALYYLMDDKLIDLGVMPYKEVAKAEYDGYIRNGLMTQLTRVEPGKSLEQAHMRNRQLIAQWCYEKGASDRVIEKITHHGKTYFKVNSYDKLRELFAELLSKVQRIKSEGDYEAGKNLVETYGIHVDKEIHKEALERYHKLKLAPFGGFVNPYYKPVYENDGTVTDIKLIYPESYTHQMLYYSENFSFLPDIN